MQEIWKDVKGYVGLYQVSNHGKIRKTTSGKLVSIVLNSTGYEQVHLSDGSKRKKHLVHRLVSDAFIPNPHNLPHVNHLDENRRNNYSDNLEWCDARYNNNYGNRNLKVSLSKKKPIKCVESGVQYESISSAAKDLGVHVSAVAYALKRNGTCCGFHFEEV